MAIGKAVKERLVLPGRPIASTSLVSIPIITKAMCCPSPLIGSRHIMGVLTELQRAGVELDGFDAVVGGDVPLGGGMSSSAALEVATVYLCSLLSEGRF